VATGNNDICDTFCDTPRVGLYAMGIPAQDVQVVFHGANQLAASSPSSGPSNIPAASFRCFNLGGTDQHGMPFAKQFSLAANDTGALWIGVDLPVRDVTWRDVT
jgi:hypothetical protein